MKEVKEKDKLFDFKKYQNAKRSMRMLIRFIIYSIVIGILFYLILREDSSSEKTTMEEDVEVFEIEIE